jgi:hypothetical protein
MSLDPVQAGLLLGLFLLFFLSETIAEWLGSYLNTLPLRLAFCLMILAMVPVDRFAAIGLLLVVAAIYIRHHQNDMDGLNLTNEVAPKGVKSPKAMLELDQGGQADESYDEMDFTSKENDQTDEFERVGTSIDEKQALHTEGLGSKSQSLFPEDSSKAAELMRGNQDGSHE